MSILLTNFFDAGCLLVRGPRFPNVVFTNEEMDTARACCFPATEGVRMAIRMRGEEEGVHGGYSFDGVCVSREAWEYAYD